MNALKINSDEHVADENGTMVKLPLIPLWFYHSNTGFMGRIFFDSW